MKTIIFTTSNLKIKIFSKTVSIISSVKKTLKELTHKRAGIV